MRKLLYVLLSIFVMSLIYIVFVTVAITSTAKQETVENADYVIVLGARLHGETMSLSLQNRVHAALEYLQNNPGAKVIVSGGQGPGESITEAEAMKRFFIEQGIEGERIIKEDQSTSTFENLKLSQPMLEEDATIVIVSNDFHLYRATVIAGRLGMEPYTLAAKTPAIVKGKMWAREYVAVAKTLIFDRE
ncbi:YdcF family protein [Halalkalibacter urbisdiaboli]|uniref:YdcF family protein n=1 Tax=Halalkalibacter urbisdiaboli TaxID=1960589 RepID=UPI0013FD624D|nr:YdcF family protein [Halalkalibacter urbisdiaboli]